MKIEMTTEQALQIAANAANASAPMGLGVLHMEDKDYSPEDVAENFESSGNGYFDYYHGRMMKTSFHKDGDFYLFPNNDPHSEYQSWARKYPTYLDLVKSVIPEPNILEAA